MAAQASAALQATGKINSPSAERVAKFLRDQDL